MKKKIIIITIIILILITIIIRLNSIKKDNFYNISEKDIKDIKNVEQKKICNTNIIDYCINFNDCCNKNDQTSIITNNNCFCNHSFVKNCNDDFNNCLSKIAKNKSLNDVSIKQKEIKCNSILEKCCSEYKNINIDNELFKPPINNTQESNILCSLTNNNTNLKEKCLELCQTDENCKAYSILPFSCNLYNNVILKDTQSATNKNYYIKQ